MNLVVTVVDPATKADQEVALIVDPDAGIDTVAEQLAEITSVADPTGPTGAAVVPQLYAGRTPLSADTGAHQSGLLDGAVIGLGAPAEIESRIPPPAAKDLLWELHVVSGPDAGRIWPLAPGSFDVGSAIGRAIRLTDPGIPHLAGWLDLQPDGTAWIRPPVRPPISRPVDRSGQERKSLPPNQSESMLRVVRIPIPDAPVVEPPMGDLDLKTTEDSVLLQLPREEDESRTRCEPGDELRCGPLLLSLVTADTPDAAVERNGFTREYNRPPRVPTPVPVPEFQMPNLPAPPTRRPIPLLIMIAPAALGLGLGWLLQSWFYLAFSALTPVLALSNWYSDRRNGRRRFRKDMGIYRIRRAAVEDRVCAAIRTEKAARSQAVPDPAAIARIVSGPGRRLWERRRSDPDHLLLRVGTAQAPPVLTVRDPVAQNAPVPAPTWMVPDTPVGVGLAELGVLGVAGPTALTRQLGAWLIVQTAVLHTPADVRIVLLTESDTAEHWAWVRWLPHLRPAFGRALSVTTTLIGNDPETVTNRVGELVTELKQRQGVARHDRAAGGGPDLVVVVDGARRMREIPGMIQLLTEGPPVRIFSICLDDAERLLPQECAAVVLIDEKGTTVRRPGLPLVIDARADLVQASWCTDIARLLAPIRDVTVTDAAGLPDSLRLLDLLNWPEPTADLVLARWRDQPASTRVLIGVGSDGPVELDLVQDGPHGIVAGTTGAGKSELLQTFVVSTALANRPDELTFVLVDYKGGSAFSHCVRLPHVLGMVTDLDDYLVQRALESFAAELRRRETLLAEVGAKDHTEYRARRQREPELPPLPRLIIMVDEFAALAKEVPDFVPGLVNIAQRGRSLGLHMILATQRPAGVMTGDLRANTNLRIALRVTDPGESMDVIEVPDAGQISTSTPGRALVRLAHRSALSFQTAFVGTPRDAGPITSGGHDVGATLLPWHRLGHLPTFTLRSSGVQSGTAAVDAGATADDEPETDLAVLVTAIVAAAKAESIPRQPIPWLPALPELLVLDQLPASEGQPVDPQGRLTAVPIGLADVPTQQAQPPFLFDLDRDGHLYVIGSPRSGRSQVLRTLAGALARVHSVADLHLYGIDAGGGGLTVLGNLPHCGGVVGRDDLERLERLLVRLDVELTIRQSALTERHCTNLSELRQQTPAAERPAHLVVMIDGLDAVHAILSEYDNGRLVETMYRVLREGPAAGIHVVLTAERIANSGRYAMMTDNRLVLRLNDAADYGSFGLRLSEIPKVVPNGRAWHFTTRTHLQVALLSPNPTGPDQAAQLRRIGTEAETRCRPVPRERRPFTVAALPRSIPFGDVFALVPAEKQRPLWALIGVGGDDMGPIGLDLGDRTGTVVVAGPPASGRSNALSAMAVSLLAGGTKLVVLAPRDSPLRRLARHENVVVIESGDPTESEVTQALAQLPTGTGALLVDDVDVFPSIPAAHSVLRDVVTNGRDRGLGVVLAGTAHIFLQMSAPWLVEATRFRRGVLLAPQSTMESDLIGARVTASMIRRSGRPGNTYLLDPVTAAPAVLTVAHTPLK